jgi:predicted transcriptional regulator
MYEEKLYSVHEMAKLLKVKDTKINYYIEQAINDLDNCIVLIGKRKKIIKDRFINYISKKSMEILCKEKTEKKKDFINEVMCGGLHTQSKVNNIINQAKTRIYQKQ